MRSISVKALKKTLAEYFRLAASGQSRSALFSDPLLAEAVREGWLTLPAVVSHEPPPRRPVMPFRELMRDLEHDRER